MWLLVIALIVFVYFLGAEWIGLLHASSARRRQEGRREDIVICKRRSSSWAATDVTVVPVNSVTVKRQQTVT